MNFSHVAAAIVATHGEPARVQHLFLEGAWLTTNAALSVQRGTGYYAGFGKAAGRRPLAEKPRTFNDEASDGLMRTVAAVRRQKIEPVKHEAMLWFWLVRHTKADPSAWTIAGKWIEDGLCKASVLRSDRFNVYAVGGRVCQSAEEGAAMLRARGLSAWERKTGMLVEIVEVAS